MKSTERFLNATVADDQKENKMIGKGAEITISRHGDTIPVEYIKAGDSVVCGITERSIRVDLIQRVSRTDIDYRNAGRPVMIKPKSLPVRTPRTLLYISGNTKCLVPRKEELFGNIELIEVVGYDIGIINNDKTYDYDQFNYFRIILERAAYVDVSGLLVHLKGSKFDNLVALR